MLYGMFVSMSPERAAYMEIYDIDSGEIMEQVNVMAPNFKDQFYDWQDVYDITEVSFEGPDAFIKPYVDIVKADSNAEVYSD